MSKQLENFSPDPKQTKARAGLLPESDNTSYRLPQLVTNNNLQVPLKQKNLNQKIKLPQSKSTPLLQTFSHKHTNFEKWASSIKSSHKAIKNPQKSEKPEKLKLPIQNIYNFTQLPSIPYTSSQNNDNHMFITITCEENSQNNGKLHSPQNNNTKKCEIKENMGLDEGKSDLKIMTSEEKDQEIAKMRKEVDCLKGLYKKFEEIYCNDTCTLKSKLEKRTNKYRTIEGQYRKAVAQISLLNDRYKKSLEIISSNQQRYTKEISELQKKFKDDKWVEGNDEGKIVD